ncbi:MAG: glycosyltransferase [Pseudomonadota bacterium]|nr:glycosyltransferase [Pseudomonadota bacterium]
MSPTIPLHAATSRLHVLQIIGNAIVGGMETCVARLVERLPSDRFRVSVLCPFESPLTERLRSSGAEVTIAAIDDEPSWQSIQLGCALVQANAIDVIQSHLPNAHVLAGLIGKLTDKPVLATIHGRQLTSIDLEVHRAAATHLAVVCRHSLLHALGVGVAARHLHLIPNGVDTEVFTPSLPRSGLLRSRFGIDLAAPLIGYVGRLSVEKGPDVFLRMALAVQAAHPGSHFVLVGEGPMKRQLQTFIEQFGLDGNVHLAGNQTEMPHVFAELDVLVSSSHSEAMPLAVMEAMACGLPVVATQVGGVADLLEHGVSGWVATDGDYEGLAAWVINLLEDDALRLQAGRAARKRAMLHFPISRNVDATMQLLTRLAQRRSENRRIGAVGGRRSAAVDGAELDPPVKRVAQIVGAQADDRFA